jgi:hypothetical protein
MIILTIEEKHLYGYVNVKKKLEIACVHAKLYTTLQNKGW